MIPKIIHQTWKTTDIPNEWKDAVYACKTLHSDFNYILWTDETMDSFVKNEYPHFYKTYTSYRHVIQRCDAFRYLVLYTYGGIYLDMDISCKKNLSDLLQYDIVLSKSSNVNSFTNAFFMAVPQHPFLKYCIDQLPSHMHQYQYFGKHMHVMYSTGPLFLTNRVSEYGPIKNEYHLTKQEYAGNCTVCNESTCTGGVYFTHIKGQTWNEMDSLFYNFCLCNKYLLLMIVFIIVFRVRIKKYLFKSKNSK